MSAVERQSRRGDRQREAEAQPVLCPPTSIVTMNSSGATARSWNSRIGETDAARRQIEPFALGQYRNDDRGRGQRERRADDESGGGRLPQARRRGAEQQRRQHDLRRGQGRTPGGASRQALERQFEPHHEQQEHHAESRDAADRLDIGQRQRVKPGRAAE